MHEPSLRLCETRLDLLKKNVVQGQEVTEGTATLDGINLLELEPDERAKAGLFLAFQYPTSIPGVTMANFLRHAVTNVRPGNFLDAFFFSVETLATVGYGVMTPATPYGHAVATVEIFVGMFLTALATGAFFARFARPRPRLLFSESAVIAPYEHGNQAPDKAHIEGIRLVVRSPALQGAQTGYPACPAAPSNPAPTDAPSPPCWPSRSANCPPSFAPD